MKPSERSIEPADVGAAGNAVIDVRINGASLVAKLDAIGALIMAVREAHRDTISMPAWAAMNRAQDAIAEAMLAGEQPQTRQLGP